MSSLKLFVALAAFAAIASVDARPDKVVCYFGSWTSNRQGVGKYDVENIDVTKCTHIIYSFIGLNWDGSILILDRAHGIDRNGLRRFTALKNQNPRLKALIAIGGASFGVRQFSAVAASATLRENFARSCVQFMQQYGFDGLDMDWEYPARFGSSPADKQNFVLMLQTLRRVFDSGRQRFLLTAAVAAGAWATDISYDVPAISRVLDFINVMTYDLHGVWQRQTGQNAPLDPHPLSSDKGLNVRACIDHWLKRGAPRSKLVLGVAAYGRSFTVWNPANNAINDGINNPGDAGIAGEFTGERGILSYTEICLRVSRGWTSNWDDHQKVPNAYQGNQWVGYDDERSIRLKAEYAIQQNLGGVMIWSLDGDDPHGACGRRHPLISVLYETVISG